MHDTVENIRRRRRRKTTEHERAGNRERSNAAYRRKKLGLVQLKSEQDRAAVWRMLDETQWLRGRTLDAAFDEWLSATIAPWRK